jgi:serine/threonine-protein kinase ATR
MATELLRLCDAPIKDNDTKTLSMARDFPLLKKQAPSDLIIPLQESLTVNLPTTSSQSSDHQPFPPDAPKFYRAYCSQ